MTRPEPPPPPNRPRPRRLALVATTPDDSHVWNLIGVQLKLEERGFRVVNLGACTPLADIVEAVRTQRPVLLVISSINGHGALSIRAILEALERAGIKNAAPIVAGGLLTADPREAERAAADLLRLGCAGVFGGEAAWDEFDAWLAGRTLWPGGRLSRPPALPRYRDTPRGPINPRVPFNALQETVMNDDSLLTAQTDRLATLCEATPREPRSPVCPVTHQPCRPPAGAEGRSPPVSQPRDIAEIPEWVMAGG